MNEIRNELLLILQITKEQNADDKLLRTQWLLERYESDIKKQLEDIQYKENQLLDNLKTLEYVRNEISKEND